MNYYAIKTIYLFEMNRTFRTLVQSILSPVLTTSLYFIVFGSAIGSRIQTIDGVDYFEGRTFTATVPIYLNSNDMYFELTSSDPFPCTLISLTWEGDYSPKYYKNV